jgi:serine/threonine protein kinase
MAVRTNPLPERYAGAQPIGRGGMGEIYRATDTMLGRAVAIKVLDERYARDQGVRSRFTREALAVARLSGNPHIVTIYDVGEQNDRPFIVMEYLGGGSLEQKLSTEGAQPPAQALDWLEQAAVALDAAHRDGIVHRDVKPANLLLDRHGRVHVADFGIASAAGMNSLTQTGTILGTAAYLSPEQAMGEPTSAASDIYSLGIVAFELLTGRRPFERDSVAAEASAHVTSEIPSVCDVNPHVPCELDPVFAKALAKDPRRRYSSAAEFVAALRASLAEAAGTTQIVPPPRGRTAATRRLSPPLPPPHRERRRRSLLPLLALLLAAGVGGAIAASVLTHGSGGKRNASVPPPAKASVSVKTVVTTAPGQTVVTTVEASTPAATTTPATSSAVSTSDPVALNNQGWYDIQHGDYNGALPLLQQAVQELQGSSSITRAYANYNLGITLIALGRCSEAVPYLDVAKQIEPGRHEVHDALKQARKCA